jgi:hypothetical protein
MRMSTIRCSKNSMNSNQRKGQSRHHPDTLRFFNREIRIDGNEFRAMDPEPLTPAIISVLASCVESHQEDTPESEGRMVSFRELSGGGPMFNRFASNTNKIIENSFAGHLDRLEARCRALDGTKRDDPAFDLSFRFQALPRIPVILNFNDREDGMPASAVFLYPETAAHLLDLKCLSTIATFLTGQLIQETGRGRAAAGEAP